MVYSIPYVILVIFYGFASLCSYSIDDKKIRDAINAVCIAVYILFFGFRGFIWDDWLSYYPEFQEISLDSVLSSPFEGQTFETGFSLFMALCKCVVDSYHFFTLVCTLVNIALLVRFFSKRITYLPLGLMLFICMEGLGFINLLRNSISILLFINSLEYIEKRKFVPFFILWLIALSFHLSSILYLPTYFFLHRKTNKWVFAAVFAIASCFVIFRIPLLGFIGSLLFGDSAQMLLLKIDSYSEYKVGAGFTLSIGYLERLFTFSLIMCYYDKLKTIRKENVLFINSMLIYFVLLFAFSEIEEVSKRLSALFVFAYWILWYDLIRVFTYGNNKWLYISFIGVYSILKTIGSSNNPTKKYDNILFGADSYQERVIYHNRNDNSKK